MISMLFTKVLLVELSDHTYYLDSDDNIRKTENVKNIKNTDVNKNVKRFTTSL